MTAASVVPTLQDPTTGNRPPGALFGASCERRASTTTDTGLAVACQLDANAYEKGIKVSDAEMASLNIKPDSFHGEWNYTIAPRRPDG